MPSSPRLTWPRLRVPAPRRGRGTMTSWLPPSGATCSQSAARCASAPPRRAIRRLSRRQSATACGRSMSNTGRPFHLPGTGR
eukprot:1865310-Alexandrium_andersonii.AAC.1